MFLETMDANKEKSPPKEEVPENRDYYKLFVCKLQYQVTREDLRSLFGKYGKVLGAHVVLDGENRSKGIGFIAYGSKEEAEAAIKALDDYELNNRRIHVDYSTQTGRIVETTGAETQDTSERSNRKKSPKSNERDGRSHHRHQTYDDYRPEPTYYPEYYNMPPPPPPPMPGYRPYPDYRMPPPMAPPPPQGQPYARYPPPPPPIPGPPTFRDPYLAPPPPPPPPPQQQPPQQYYDRYPYMDRMRYPPPPPPPSM